MRSFIAALQFLTIFPWPRRAQCAENELGSAAAFFPAIGLLLGLILVLLNALLEPVSTRGLSSVLLVATLVWLTGGLHMDGLADTFDGLGARGDRECVLRIMDDSHTGAFGVMAIVVLLFLKVYALESVDHERWRVLIAAPVLGRWSMVIFGYGSVPAKPGLGSRLLQNLKFNDLLFASLLTLLLIATLLRLAGLVTMICVAGFSLAAKNYFHRRLGGVTGDTFGAVGELSEASVLVFFALGAR